MLATDDQITIWVSFTLRKRPYCIRPPCRRCLSARNASCRCVIQRGACARTSYCPVISTILWKVSWMLTLSTSPACTVPVTAPSTPYSLPIYCFSTFTRIGRNRSSSSILGNAFAVAYDTMMINLHSSSCSSQYTYFQRSWQHPPEFIHDQTDLIRHWHISNTSFNVDWSIR